VPIVDLNYVGRSGEALCELNGITVAIVVLGPNLCKKFLQAIRGKLVEVKWL
jgi:hypothetical protein